MPCIVTNCPRPGAVVCNMHRRRLERNGTVRELQPIDHFMRHVTELPSGCWEYGPAHPETGYAQFTVDNGKRRELAHRWSYEFFIAPIPGGLEIDHLCRNRACVNPWHLEPVTRRVNAKRGVGSADTCVNGHPYDEINTEIHARGYRQCRTCRYSRERRAAASALGG